jgi:hypothetical protein
LHDLGIEQSNAENAEQNTVDHTGDFDGIFDSKDPFCVDGVVEQEEKGKSFNDADDAESIDGGAKHAWVVGLFVENDKYLEFDSWNLKLKVTPCQRG